MTIKYPSWAQSNSRGDARSYRGWILYFKQRYLRPLSKDERIIKRHPVLRCRLHPCVVEKSLSCHAISSDCNRVPRDIHIRRRASPVESSAQCKNRHPELCIGKEPRRRFLIRLASPGRVHRALFQSILYFDDAGSAAVLQSAQGITHGWLLFPFHDLFSRRHCFPR